MWDEPAPYLQCVASHYVGKLCLKGLGRSVWRQFFLIAFSGYDTIQELKEHSSWILNVAESFKSSNCGYNTVC